MHRNRNHKNEKKINNNMEKKLKQIQTIKLACWKIDRRRCTTIITRRHV